MVRGRGKQILSITETEGLVSEKKELESALREATEYGKGTSAEQLDTNRIRQQINHIDEALHDGKAPKVSGTEKDKLVKEAAMLEQEIGQGMPTRDEMSHPAKNPGAVRKHMQWNIRNQEKIERYRYIQRIINPDDPRSIENLRREK